MIPKVINYCWFGRSPLPYDAEKCIDSWKKYFDDYEIVEWNEDNFDVNTCEYISEAYSKKKYAFVSDYVRFWVLYYFGGIYFDTDVEVVSDMSHIVERGPFMGFEKSLATNSMKTDAEIGVAPGLGMGATPGLPLYASILEYYENRHFDMADGTVVRHITGLLKSCGLRNVNEIQKVAGITIYPDDFFCPMDSTTGIITHTRNTVSVHHYSCSWMDHHSLSFKLHLLKKRLIKIFGPEIIMPISRMLK